METNDIVSLEDLTEIGYKFSELGDIITEMSASNTRLFDETLDNLRTLQTVTDSLSMETINRLKDEVGVHMEHAPHMLNLYTNSVLDVDNVFKSLNSSVTQFKDSIGNQIGKPSPDKPSPDKSGSQKAKSKKGIIDREIKSTSMLIKGFVSKMKIPLAGGVVAGGMIWMAMGFRRTQRIQAEAGEVKNILISATDATVKGMIDKATSHLSGIQEHLQKTYGVIRSDFQNVVKAFVNGGVKIEQVLGGIGGELGEASENTLLFTYALDKMFELPGGTSATRVVQMMSEYGYTLGEAREKLTDMMMAGRESGIGMTQFMKNVMSSGDDLKRYGFDLEAISDLALTLQDRFEELGVPKQFAGRQAAIGMKQMASGLVSLSMDWQMLIAEKMGYGSGLEGRQNMVSAQQRVAKEGGTDDLMEIYRVMASVAMDTTGGDETLARQVLEQMMGLGFEGAISAIEILKAINSGDVASAKKLAQGHEKELRDSLMTEKQKRNVWELQMNNWLDAVSMVGEGLLSMLATLVAYIMVFGKSALSLISNYIMGRTKDNDDIINDLNLFMKENPFKTDTLIKGAEKMADVTKDMGLNMLGSGVQALKSAWDFTSGDSKKDAPPESTTPSKRPASPFTGAGRMSTPIVQTITAPSMESPSMPPKYASDEGRRGTEPGPTPESNRKWVGGKASIVSNGANAVGDIKLSLAGNCPRCGLIFGDKPPIVQGESIEVFNPNTQKSSYVDPTSAVGMDKLSQMSIAGKARRGKKETRQLDPRLGEIIKQISEEFPGKRVNIYRGATESSGKGQHAAGTAMDIGVEGVESEELFDFLLENVEGGGKGYYPEQPFVHVDVRPGKAVWVDESKKGESSEGKVIGGPEATASFKTPRNKKNVESEESPVVASSSVGSVPLTTVET